MASQSHQNQVPYVNVSEIEEEQPQAQAQELKYLGFVHAASTQALMRWSAAYNYAKDSSGSLKPGVQTVEECMKNVIEPIYNNYHLVPNEILRYADKKVDASVAAMQVAPAAARDTITEAMKNVYTKYEPSAKELYERYEPVAEQYAASAWQRLNSLPLFPRLVGTMLPTAAYCTAKYNEAVMAAVEDRYRVSPYLPLVPTEKIARVFSGKTKKQE
ncbi:hypothetical protein HN51_013228 [Arachis hypogaea]|nr:stress-related protein-like isoform X1 [Arachis hypogaea]